MGAPRPGVQTHTSPTQAGELAPALTTVARLRSSVLYVQVVMSSSPWGVQTQTRVGVRVQSFPSPISKFGDQGVCNVADLCSL